MNPDPQTFRRTVWLATIAVAALLVGTPARANGFTTGNQLLPLCQSASTDKVTYCVGYVTALADVLGNSAINGVRACFPTSATKAQIVDIAIQFLNEHPERRHYTADSLVAHALVEAFPCKH